MKELQTRRFELESKLAQGKFPHAKFSVFEAKPEGEVKGGILLIQEIFGVNAHIQRLARHYAEKGYLVWAPAYFDHLEPGIELGYNDSTFARGRELAKAISWDQALDDTKIAAEALRKSLSAGRNKIASIGFCWGGSLAWISATRLGRTFDACVSYYGRQVWDYREEKPQVPVMLHYGEKDPMIPMLNVRAIEKAQPELPVYVYPAGHGFNCDERRDFDPEAARLAEERTFKFLAENGI